VAAFTFDPDLDVDFGEFLLPGWVEELMILSFEEA
jgi:hypothetical protein